MADQWILDPTELTGGTRDELNITPWIRQEGPNGLEGAVEFYRSDAVGGVGQRVLDYRVTNSSVVMPLVVKNAGGTTFEAARNLIQAKASLLQNEGGWVKRVTAGGTAYADVATAVARFSAGWLQAHRSADNEAEIVLECSPDWYGDEIELDAMTGTGDIIQVLRQSGAEARILGDFPAGNRSRIVVTDTSGTAQHGLISAFRSRNYSGSATAALSYEAEALGALDLARAAALTGASGGTAITHSSLPPAWTPVVNLALGGTAALTHTGEYRTFARLYSTDGTAVAARLVYERGDLVIPSENAPEIIPGASEFYLVDLGGVSLQPGAAGAHSWSAQVQAQGTAGGENLSVDKIWLVPLDEFMAAVITPSDLVEGLAGPSARDEFNQAAGALTGKTAQVGGVWIGAGAVTDFAVSATATAERSARSDSDLAGEGGRFVVTTSPSAASDVVVEVETELDLAASTTARGLIARYVDINNWFQIFVTNVGASLWVQKRIAGTVTQFETGRAIPALETNQEGGGTAGERQKLRLHVDAYGHWSVWAALADGRFGDPIAFGFDGDLAPGGRLATGRVGMFARNGSSSTTVSTFDKFRAWVPNADAVLFPLRSAELRTDGMEREKSTGGVYGKLSRHATGNFPRIPCAGNPVEIMLKGTRGNLAASPDWGLDGISAQVFYRPCWSSVPG